MNDQVLITHVTHAIARTLRGEAYLDKDCLDIRGFSTPTMRRLFSNICHLPGATYLECGLYCGGTFVSAFNNNPIHAIGVEDFSQDFGVASVKQELAANVDAKRKTADSVEWIDADFFTVGRQLVKTPVDIYFYDGNHALEFQRRALPEALPLLNDSFIHIVDDYNWQSVNEGTAQGLKKSGVTIKRVWRFCGQQMQDDPVWHNGVCVMVLSKPRIGGSTALHTGDLGDIIAALPTLRALGGAHLVIAPRTGPNQGRETMKGARFDFIAPLLNSVPYIKSVSWSDNPTSITWDFSSFRSWPRVVNESLATWQAHYFGFRSVDLSPWINVEPLLEANEHVVTARSLRYQNPRFNWHRAVRANASRVLFLGLPNEYHAFRQVVNSQFQPRKEVQHRPVKDALEMARVIAGSKLFIGNQSFPCWLAMAMSHPLIQESWKEDLNSMIERPNAQFCAGQYP